MTASRRRAAVVLLSALFGVAATARLGVWQLDRAAQKVALQEALDSRARLPALAPSALARTAAEGEPQHYRRIHLRGRWLEGRTVYLDNRQMDGRTGFYVVTPLLLAAPGDAVLVQRGWVPRSQLDRTALPALATPSGEVEIDGVIAPPPARLYDFAGAASGVIRQNLDLASFAAETGLDLRPVSVQQVATVTATKAALFPATAAAPDEAATAAGDGLLRRWPRPAVDVHKHYGYAFQWFALAALMTGLYVWFQLVRPRLGRHA